MVDYNRALATAQRLIRQSGRLVAMQGVKTGPAAPDNPLAGPAAPPAPLTGIPATFVQPSSLQSLGASATLQKLFAECEQVAIVAPVTNDDYTAMKFLIDTDGITWKIERVEKLKPGMVTILYFIGVKLP